MANKASVQKKLVWEIYAAIRPKLNSLGFGQVRPGVFSLRISTDATGWLTLDAVQRVEGNGVGIFPKVSLSFDAVERLRAAIDRRERDPAQHTFGQPLYLLMANPMKNNTWEFSPVPDQDLVLSDLVAAIDRYGVPYLRSFSDLHSLRRYLEDASRDHAISNISYVLPMTLYAIGDVPGTRRTLLKFLSEAERSGSPIYVKTYGQFARNFQQFIDEQESTG